MNKLTKLFTKKPHQTENKSYKIITELEPNSIAAEAYRRVKVGLEYSYVDKNLKVIQVCSSMQGEGKTLTALNLAACYAEDKKKVIIVDLDFRRPKLHRTLKIENKDGITDYLAGNITKEALIKHANAGFDVINRGTKVPYPTTILGSEQLATFINELKEEYDLVLLDCPPILAVSDAVIVSKLADGCLFIASQTVTKKPAAKDAVGLLKANGVNILGVVLTNVQTKKGNSYYSYRYKYYYQDYAGKK